MEPKIVSLKDVTFSYKGSKRQALRGVSLDVKEGECVAILGPTGAGKSTLACVINGTVPRFIEGKLTGDVVVDGQIPNNVGTAQMASRVGLVFGDPDTQLFGMTVEEDVAFGPANLGFDYETIMERITRAIEDMRLQGLEQRAPHRLSGGQKQATAIAGVYAMLPKIMVLDEPTSMLDPEGKARVFSIIRDLNKSFGMTIILIEQEVDDILELADRVFVMKSGEFVLGGTPEEVFAAVDELKEVGIRVPSIVEFGNLIGADKTPFSVEEAVSTVKSGAWNKAIVGDAPIEDRAAPGLSVGSESTQDTAPILEAVDLEFRYPLGVKALDGASLEVYPGEFVAIVGQNGAGKTTLTRHFNGLLRPSAGDIRLFGKSVLNEPTASLCATVGYVFQNPDEQLFCDTVEDELRFGPMNIGMDKDRMEESVRDILLDIGLDKYRQVWPRYLTKGERQRLALASVVAMEPEILIVDEPTTGLDWLESLQILDYLERLRKEKGKTILIITHDMNIVSLYAKRVVVMANGRVVGEGTPREVFSQPKLMELAYLRRPQIADLSDTLWGEVLLTPHEAADRLKRSSSTNREVAGK
ncbi:MAG: ATP-binding cassette domain-containing protein [Firmicutes bacterium]|nr:ATP-binding cassette domain-containing protein [Bacillota bacterium]